MTDTKNPLPLEHTLSPSSGGHLSLWLLQDKFPQHRYRPPTPVQDDLLETLREPRTEAKTSQPHTRPPKSHALPKPQSSLLRIVSTKEGEYLAYRCLSGVEAIPVGEEKEGTNRFQKPETAWARRSP